MTRRVWTDPRHGDSVVTNGEGTSMKPGPPGVQARIVRYAQGRTDVPGTNAGTGQPISFMCSACRRNPHRIWPQGFSSRVTLTGRTKEINDGRANGRSTNHRREYECTDCGHVGWSRHADLKRKADAAESQVHIECHCGYSGSAQHIVDIDASTMRALSDSTPRCPKCERLFKSVPTVYPETNETKEDADEPHENKRAAVLRLMREEE